MLFQVPALLAADIFQAGEISLVSPFFFFFAISSSACWSKWDWILGMVSRGGEGWETPSLASAASITHKSMYKQPVLALCTPAACPGMDKSLFSAQALHLLLHHRAAHCRNGDIRALSLPLTAWRNSSWLPALTHTLTFHAHRKLRASYTLKFLKIATLFLKLTHSGLAHH